MQAPHCFDRGPCSKHVDNLAADIPDSHSFSDMEVPRAGSLHWVQATRMHSDVHGWHGEQMAMPELNHRRSEQHVAAMCRAL